MTDWNWAEKWYVTFFYFLDSVSHTPWLVVSAATWENVAQNGTSQSTDECCFKLFQSCVQTSYWYQTVHEPRGKKGRLQTFDNSGRPISAYVSWDFPQYHIIQQSKPSCMQLEFMWKTLSLKPQKTCNWGCAHVIKKNWPENPWSLHKINTFQPNWLWFRLPLDLTAAPLGCLATQLQMLTNALLHTEVSFQKTVQKKHPHSEKTQGNHPRKLGYTILSCMPVLLHQHCSKNEYQRSQHVSSSSGPSLFSAGNSTKNSCAKEVTTKNASISASCFLRQSCSVTDSWTASVRLGWWKLWWDSSWSNAECNFLKVLRNLQLDPRFTDP